MKKDFLNISDLTQDELIKLIETSIIIKKNQEDFLKALNGKTLLMMFQKPSLRTRISFEVCMAKLGGHAIYYNTNASPMNVGESIADTARCVSRYADIILARFLKQSDTIELAKHSSVPVIDGLSDVSHPCQIVADLMTIKEKKGKMDGLKLSYLGDADNNVTYSLMQGCSKIGINMYIASPNSISELNQNILKETKENATKNSCKLIITKDIDSAVKDADIIVTDTWMSYHIPQDQKEARVKKFMPYQVNNNLMSKAKKDAILMHCLPAKRGYEVTNEVIDSNQSVVFDEAENRLWSEMAIILFLLGKLA